MAVSKMKLLNIIGKYDKLDETVEACMESGCFHPESTADLMENVRGFSRINEENPYEAPLSRLTEIMTEMGIPFEPTETDDSSVSEEELRAFMDEIRLELTPLRERREQIRKESAELDDAAEQLEHFKGLDVRLEKVFACRFTKVRFGRIPAESYELLKSFHSNPYVLFFPCSSDSRWYWGMYVTPVTQKENVDRIFQSLFFERLWLPDLTGTPEEALADLRGRRAALQREYEEIERKIADFTAARAQKCRRFHACLVRKRDIFEARKYGARQKDAFMQIGWVPEDQAERVTEKLAAVDGIEYRVEEPEVLCRVDPPVKLKNKKPFRPFEFFVEMYGLPSYGEADPTAFLAMTYTILFGIMFADLGQGLILALAGLLMWKLKKMPLGRILIPCGISGSLFGLVFGSVFGFEEALDPLYHALGLPGKPFDAMGNVNTLLIVSLGIGVFLVLCAMLINIYSCVKRRRWEGALLGTNGLAGLSIYGTALFLALSMLTGRRVPTVPAAAVGIGLPLVLMLFREPLGKLLEGKKNAAPESWGEYLAQAFFELFESVLSYVTNTVSFLRVGAFVLVHAGMMTTFLYLGELVGGGVPGALMIVFGNALVILLEGLLVGIQVLRLQYYEMFSRFFEGGGRPFEPLGSRTRNV